VVVLADVGADTAVAEADQLELFDEDVAGVLGDLLLGEIVEAVDDGQGGVGVLTGDVVDLSAQFLGATDFGSLG
jgi:hypothetical protein